MSTFLQLQDDTLERLNLPTDASSTARTRVKRYINEGYRLLLADVGMSRARHSTTTIATVAGTAEYTVTASKIRFIRDTANNLLLQEVTLGEIRSVDAGNDSDGNPTQFAVVQYITPTTIKVRLWPIPSEVLTLDVDIVAAVTDLTADADLPVFASEFHHVLGIYARMCEYEKMDDTRKRDASKEYVDAVRQMRYFLRKSDSRATVFGGGARGYSSSLGPDFPDRQ
jgi:hypothetical protein